MRPPSQMWRYMMLKETERKPSFLRTLFGIFGWKGNEDEVKDMEGDSDIGSREPYVPFTPTRLPTIGKIVQESDAMGDCNYCGCSGAPCEERTGTYPNSWSCTRKKGHSGEHVACSSQTHFIIAWEEKNKVSK